MRSIRSALKETAGYMRRMFEVLRQYSSGDAAAELSEAGFSKAKEMEDRILRAGDYAKL